MKPQHPSTAPTDLSEIWACTKDGSVIMAFGMGDKAKPIILDLVLRDDITDQVVSWFPINKPQWTSLEGEPHMRWKLNQHLHQEKS